MSPWRPLYPGRAVLIPCVYLWPPNRIIVLRLEGAPSRGEIHAWQQYAGAMLADLRCSIEAA